MMKRIINNNKIFRLTLIHNKKRLYSNFSSNHNKLTFGAASAAVIAISGGILLSYYQQQLQNHIATAAASSDENNQQEQKKKSDSSRPKLVPGKDFADASRFYIQPSQDSNVKLFTGNANHELSVEIALCLGVNLGRAIVKRFTDGEVNVTILDNIRGRDVYVIQPISPPTNENLMELLLMISTLRRASAGTITAVIPYFGYGRSPSLSLMTKPETAPIAAADVAKMLEVVGVDRVITIDLHHPQIQGYFETRTPCDNLDVSSISIPYFDSKNLTRPVVVSPDENGAIRARSFRDKLIAHGHDAGLAIIVDHEKKQRGQTSGSFNPEEATSLVGDVKGRDVIIFDDMVDSAVSATRAARKLKAKGAKRIYVFCTHGLFLNDALSRIDDSPITEVVCTNSIPLPHNRTQNDNRYSEKIHQLSIGPFLAEVILRFHEQKSLSSLFFDKRDES